MENVMDKETIDFEVKGLAPLTDLARKALGTEIQTIKRDRDGDVPFIVTDDGRELHSVQKLVTEFERTQPTPYRRRGTYKAADIASLLRWMTSQAQDDSPVFGVGLEALNGEWREPKLALVGIGNYSTDIENPAWHDFSARYDFPVSIQWKTWARFHAEEGDPAAKWFDQAEFAEFIESRIHELSTPQRNEALSEAVTRFLEASGKKDAASPAELFKLSRDLKIFSDSKIETKIDLQSGETVMQYSEEHTGPSGRPVKIPSLFYIRIPVFFGQPPVLIGVKLRYRAGRGSIVWSYSLFAPELIVADEFAKACDQVTKEGRTLYLGAPDIPNTP